MGGPEPLEIEINKILGSKREDRFSDHFSDLYHLCKCLLTLCHNLFVRKDKTKY